MEIVKNSGNSVVLLVLDDASYQKAEKEGVNLEELGHKVSTGQQQEQQSPPPVANGAITGVPQPRLCYLVKEEKGYGFSLKTTVGENLRRRDWVGGCVYMYICTPTPIYGSRDRGNHGKQMGGQRGHRNCFSSKKVRSSKMSSKPSLVHFCTADAGHSFLRTTFLMGWRKDKIIKKS